MEEICSHPTAEHYMVPFDKRPCQEGTHGPKGQSKSKELTLILHDKAPLMEENRCVHVLCVGALPGSMESGGYGCRARGRPPNLFRPIEYCWTSDTSCASYASYRCVTRCATGYLFCNPVQYVERVARRTGACTLGTCLRRGFLQTAFMQVHRKAYMRSPLGNNRRNRQVVKALAMVYRKRKCWTAWAHVEHQTTSRCCIAIWLAVSTPPASCRYA